MDTEKPTPEPRAGDESLQDRQLRQAETAISHLLRGGVLTSMLFVGVGMALSFWNNPGWLQDHDVLPGLLSGRRAYPITISQVVTSMHGGRGQGFIMFGLLVLIATPVMRVALSVGTFALQRDRLYVAITLVVLAALFTSFLIGAVG